MGTLSWQLTPMGVNWVGEGLTEPYMLTFLKATIIKNDLYT